MKKFFIFKALINNLVTIAITLTISIRAEPEHMISYKKKN